MYVVNLKQSFGDYNYYTKYTYLINEKVKVGDIVSDYKNYVGIVTKIISDETYSKKDNVYPLNKLKLTESINDTEAVNILSKLLSTKAKERMRRLIDKDLERGYYIDPNFGFVDIGYDDYDIDEDDDYQPCKFTKEASHILKNLKDIK